MKKIIVMFKKKAGMSTEEFRRYYEASHVPLILKHMPMIRSYQRNYIEPEITRLPTGATEPSFDVITEVLMDNDTDFDRYQRILDDPEVRREILADEANFIEPGTIWRLSVTEVKSPLRPTR